MRRRSGADWGWIVACDNGYVTLARSLPRAPHPRHDTASPSSHILTLAASLPHLAHLPPPPPAR